ncbi:TPA: LOW QUALITY PROTEIN: hypothetical protein N0F65_009046 [Lagenidium giganteum]|uniref:DUF7769 domain-containing protein n=1 Tax=Lagenidium giganteum TaxID=4803 RepID=A0AAV2YVP4_9STRA|nr:TPA: LOW QUALITY PROTEIN: hypothetical protein N0F65_009046 [Lagenidium giganteum]
MPGDQTSNAKRISIMCELFRVSNEGKLTPKHRRAVAKHFGVSRGIVNRIWVRCCASSGYAGKRECGPILSTPNVDSRANERGRKPLDRDEACRKIRETDPLERTSKERVSFLSGVSYWLVSRLITEGRMLRVARRTKPLLTPTHEYERLRFATSFVREDPSGEPVFRDETDYFYYSIRSTIWSRIRMAASRTCPCKLCNTKNFILKVMFVCAVARPRDGFNGKLGIWSITTLRNSKNRPKGILDTQNVSVDVGISRKYLVDKIIPAIKDSIQSLQSRTRPKNIGDLIADAKKAFDETKPTTLNCTFLTLQTVMHDTMLNGGKNNFNSRHIQKASLMRSRLLPWSLRCEKVVFQRAKQTFRECRGLERRPKSIPIYLQQDNARPHVPVDDPEIHAACVQGGWRIQFTRHQCLGYGLFFMQSSPCSTKNQCETYVSSSATCEAQMPPLSLNNTFHTLQHVFQQVINERGVNSYKPPRQRKAKLRRLGELLPVACEEDAEMRSLWHHI